METGLNLKLKKALAEMLFLSILEEQARPILEVTKLLNERSKGVCNMQFPYAIIYRMTENGYIEEKGSDMSENRKRTFYMVTNAGKEYLNGLKKEYADFIDAVDKILSQQG